MSVDGCSVPGGACGSNSPDFVVAWLVIELVKSVSICSVTGDCKTAALMLGGLLLSCSVFSEW